MATSGEAPLSTISGATLEKAKKELFEDPEQRGELISQLRDKIDNWTPSEDKDEQDLTFTRKDDHFLLRFLRAKKFDLDRSLQLYVNFHKYRKKYAHLLGDMSVSTVKHVLRSGVVSVLPPTDGPRVLVIRAACLDVDAMAPGDILKTMLLVFDKLMENEDTQVHGIMAVEDLDGFSLFSTMKIAGHEAVRRGVLIELIQESFPGRFKGVHFINQPWYFSLVYNILRPFLKQKLRDRFRIHGTDFESLFEHIPPEDLPLEYNGGLLSTDEYTADKLFEEELRDDDECEPEQLSQDTNEQNQD